MIGVPPDSARQFTHVTVEPWPLPAIADDQLGLGVVIQSTTAGTVNQPGRVGIILLRTGRAIAGLFLFFGGPVDTSGREHRHRCRQPAGEGHDRVARPRSRAGAVGHDTLRRWHTHVASVRRWGRAPGWAHRTG
jgi:hypothetical protein